MRETDAKLSRRDPSPFCVSPLDAQSFFTASFRDTLAGARGSVSERVLEVPRVFVFRILFSSALDACLELFNLPRSQTGI